MFGESPFASLAALLLIVVLPLLAGRVLGRGPWLRLPPRRMGSQPPKGEPPLPAPPPPDTCNTAAPDGAQRKRP